MKKWTSKQYAEALYALLEKGNTESVLKSFTHTLQKNGDMQKASEIARHFDHVWHEKNNKVKVEATVKDTRSLQSLPKKIGGKEVALSVRMDPTVLGGVRLKIGDFLIDGTVRSRINGLKRALMGNESRSEISS